MRKLPIADYWPDQKLPALKNKTPLQAIKTSGGKEMVEALLTEFEQRGKHSKPPLDPAIIVELRERVGEREQAHVLRQWGVDNSHCLKSVG